MTIHLSKSDKRVFLMIRAEGPDVIGDARFEVEPGEILFGRTYDEWMALPDGPYDFA